MVYDGSWDGFLSAVFEAYDRKLTKVSISKSVDFQPGIFGDSIEVFSDATKANRVWLGLQKKLSVKALNDIYSSFLSGLAEMDNHLLHYIQFALTTIGAELAFGEACILRVSQVSKMVHREKHRMEAFIRFQLTRDNIYYAVIEPDYNVIPLLISHFKNRYADQNWLIYDLRRDYGIFYNLKTVEEVTLTENTIESGQSMFSDTEVLYQTLWKDYFKSVNITERKNTKLHLHHVPKRYWKHLTEKFL